MELQNYISGGRNKLQKENIFLKLLRQVNDHKDKDDDDDHDDDDDNESGG